VGGAEVGILIFNQGPFLSIYINALSCRRSV
jgi:hypothetical protein